MALSQHESRDLVLGSAQASETTYSAFAATATTQELRIVTSQGGAVTGVTPFKLLQKTADGVKSTRTIDPASIVSIGTASTAAETQTSVTFATITAPVVGQQYVLQLRFYNAGALSHNQWQDFYGNFVSTDTSQETVVDGLITSLNRNFIQYPGATTTTNPLVTAVRGSAGATSTLIVTSKTQPLALGIDEGRRVEFDAYFYRLDANNCKVEVSTNTKVGGSDGSGTLKQIQNLEFFSKKNYGDIYGQMGFPNVFPGAGTVVADNAAGYHTIDILYRHEGGAFTQHNIYGQITMAVAGAALVQVNALVNNLEIATGRVIPDLT